jgi:glycosyltransferase involved in cell wall biosynthesis
VPKPLLLLSDSPTSPTGLGRITRELAIRIHGNMQDVFRVATFGVGGTSSRNLPFQQYGMQVSGNMVVPELPKVWKDFAGDEEGVLLTIWNPSWLWWIAEPQKLPAGPLRDFMEGGHFKKWAYLPIDGDTVAGRLPQSLGNIMQRFDRILAYTEYGAKVVDTTINPKDPTLHLPHGLDTSVFYPRPREEARRTFVQRVVSLPGSAIHPKIFMVGVVATNSARKDWYLAFETCAELLKRGVNVGLWVHTDAYQKTWDLPMLADEFGMKHRTMWTNHELSDDEMAWAYSAMDVTLGIGSEGWGYPLAESLACGVSVVHMDYAGGSEIVPKSFQVKASGYRGDGFYGVKRPVFKASDWADVAMKGSAHGLSLMSPRIEWKNAWPLWDKWLREGVE